MKKTLPRGKKTKLYNFKVKEIETSTEGNNLLNKDKQARKYMLTINNPQENGFTHEKIKKIASEKFGEIIYWCMSDEAANTPHTHIYFSFKNPVRFSTLKNAFPTAHIEVVRGTTSENRDYINKEGKWKNTEKEKTVISGTFEEFGEIPMECPGKRNDMQELYQYIQQGLSNKQIFGLNPNLMRHAKLISQLRQDILYDSYRENNRNVKVYYIYGKTRTGKTSYVLNEHGIKNVYIASGNKNIFDSYNGQPVILFDEFHGQIELSQMLRYLDRYPVELPARYSDKMACYTTVYVVSNEKFSKLYSHERYSKPDTYQAFEARFNKIEHISYFLNRKQKMQKYIQDISTFPKILRKNYPRLLRHALVKNNSKNHVNYIWLKNRLFYERSTQKKSKILPMIDINTLKQLNLKEIPNQSIFK